MRLTNRIRRRIFAYLFGEGKAVKYSAKPCSQATVELPEPLTDGYLRDALREKLSGGEGCLDFMVLDELEAATGYRQRVFQRAATGQTKVTSAVFSAFCQALGLEPVDLLVEARDLLVRHRAATADALRILERHLALHPEKRER